MIQDVIIASSSQLIVLPAKDDGECEKVIPGLPSGNMFPDGVCTVVVQAAEGLAAKAGTASKFLLSRKKKCKLFVK